MAANASTRKFGHFYFVSLKEFYLRGPPGQLFCRRRRRRRRSFVRPRHGRSAAAHPPQNCRQHFSLKIFGRFGTVAPARRRVEKLSWGAFFRTKQNRNGHMAMSNVTFEYLAAYYRPVNKVGDIAYNSSDRSLHL